MVLYFKRIKGEINKMSKPITEKTFKILKTIGLVLIFIGIALAIVGFFYPDEVEPNAYYYIGEDDDGDWDIYYNEDNNSYLYEDEDGDFYIHNSSAGWYTKVDKSKYKIMPKNPGHKFYIAGGIIIAVGVVVYAVGDERRRKHGIASNNQGATNEYEYKPEESNNTQSNVQNEYHKEETDTKDSYMSNSYNEIYGNSIGDSENLDSIEKSSTIDNNDYGVEEVGYNYCPYCGTMITPETKFCPNCGKRLK